MKPIVIIISIAMLLSLSSCICVVDGDDCRFGQSHLEYENSTELTAQLSGFLAVESGVGDVDLTGVKGDNCSLTIEYKEYKPGDAEFFIDEKGMLSYRTKSGKDALITLVKGTVPAGTSLDLDVGVGDVTIRDFGDVQTVELELGTGDAEVSGFESIHRLDVETGTGDIDISGINILQEGDLESGTGSISVRSCKNIEMVMIEQGAGSLLLDNVQGRKFECDSGMGGITVRNSQIRSMVAELGMGDVTLQNALIQSRRFEMGMGHVIEERDVK